MNLSRKEKIKLLKMCIELIKFGSRVQLVKDVQPGLSELEHWLKELELN